MISEHPDFSVTIAYEPDVPCVLMRWQGYATSSMFRSSVERVLMCLDEHQALNLLGDIRDYLLLAAEDQEWLLTNVMPRAFASGLRRCALIQPTFYFNRVAVENVQQKTDPKRISIGLFASIEEGRAWLRERAET